MNGRPISTTWYSRYFVFACVVFGVASNLAADEVIEWKGTRVRSGEILGFRNGLWELQTSSGIAKIAQADIKEIRSNWLPPHIAGDEHFARGEFEAALDDYQQAYQIEQRAWVRQRVMAQIVRCHQNLDQWLDACEHFDRLVAEEKDSPYLAFIPLAWSNSQQPTSEMQKLFAGWSNPKESPVRRLTAASWNLTTSQRKSAIETLRQVGRASDEARRSEPRLTALVRAQFWRTQLQSAGAKDVARWQTSIDEMPQELRAGPYLQLGLLQARLQQYDDAALTLLRIPLLYPDQHPLAQIAQTEAAKALEAAGHIKEKRLLLPSPSEERKICQSDLRMNLRLRKPSAVRTRYTVLFNLITAIDRAYSMSWIDRVIPKVFPRVIPPVFFAQGDSTSGSDVAEKVATHDMWSIIFSGGWSGVLIMLALIGLSLTAVYLICEHFLTIRRREVIPEGLDVRIRELLSTGRLKEAEKACHEEPSFLSFVLLHGIAEAEDGWAAIEKALEDASSEQAAKLLRKIEYLSVIGSLAPMVGLLGTVTGMLMTFHQVATTQGTAGASDLAEGIYQALVTTVVGLVIAIPALGAFAFFRNRVDQLVAEASYTALHTCRPLKRYRPATAATVIAPPLRGRDISG